MITPEFVDFQQLRALFLAEHDLAFVLGNPAHKGESVIYITNDRELGKLDLTIANNSASAIVIGPESLLQIYASPPLAEADVKRIKLGTQSWNLTPGEDCLELRCSAQITIPSKGILTIPFVDVMASGEATTGFFVFEYSGFKGISDDSRRVTVFVQRPPKGESPPLTFDTGVRSEYAGQQSRTVYVTPWAITTTKAGIGNHIVLLAGNSRADTPIKSSPTSDPKIVVSFTSGNSDLSLCTDEQIKVVSGKTVQGPVWRIERDNTGPVPVWTMRPPRDAANVFDAGGLISVRFEGIVSQLAPNFASPMFIQFVNIPGYNDGYAAFFLQKIGPVPFIRSFEAYAGSKKLEKDAIVGYKEKVTLTWDVFAAESCLIEELGKEFPPSQFTDVLPTTSKVNFTITPKIGSESRSEWRKGLSLSVSLPVAAIKAVPEPVTIGASTTVSWACANGSYCIVSGPGAPQGNQSLTGSFVVTPSPDTLYEVTCHGAGSTNARVMVRVPLVEADIHGTVSRYLCMVGWSTKWAVSCEVFRDGQRISTDLGGCWQEDSRGFTVGFKLIAKGRNEVKKEVWVTPPPP